MLQISINNKAKKSDLKFVKNINFIILLVTRRKGLEPLTSVLETKILPLNYPLILYSHL